MATETKIETAVEEEEVTVKAEEVKKDGLWTKTKRFGKKIVTSKPAKIIFGATAMTVIALAAAVTVEHRRGDNVQNLDSLDLRKHFEDGTLTIVKAEDETQE